jgi:hypothetical protein
MAKISQINDLKDKLNRSGKIIFRGNETGKILIENRKLSIILETEDNELLKDLRSNATEILKVKGERYDYIEIILNNQPYAKISKERKTTKYFRGKDIGIFIKEMESGFEQGFDCIKNLSDTSIAEFSGKTGPISEKEIKKLISLNSSKTKKKNSKENETLLQNGIKNINFFSRKIERIEIGTEFLLEKDEGNEYSCCCNSLIAGNLMIKALSRMSYVSGKIKSFEKGKAEENLILEDKRNINILSKETAKEIEKLINEDMKELAKSKNFETLEENSIANSALLK